MDLELKTLLRENERLKAAFTVLLAKYKATKKENRTYVLDKEDAEMIMLIAGHKPRELEVINFEAVEVGE